MGLVADISRTMQEGGRLQAEGLLQAAQARAQGQLQSGQVWGNTLASLGQTIAQIPAQMQQQQAAQQEQQIHSMQLQNLKAAQAAQVQANQVIAALPRNEDGTFDTGTLLQQLAAKNVPLDAQEKLAGSVDGVNKIIASFNTQKRDHAADLADAILRQHGPGEAITPDSVHLGLAAAQAAGLASAQDVDHLTQALGQGANPEQVLKTIRGLGSKFAAEKPVSVAEGASLVDPQTGQAIFTGAPKAPTEAELALRAANGDPTASAAMDRLKPPPAPRSPTEAELAVKAAAGDQGALAALRFLKPAPGMTPDAAAQRSDAKTVAAGIKQFVDTGEGLSPEILMSSRTTQQGMALNAELQRMGVDTGKLTREWVATKGAIKSLNGPSQIRLAEVINKASASLDQLDTLNQQWSDNASRWGIKALNRASLTAAKNGVYGPEAASVATRLEGQIADVTSELGQGIMGGNSPTDHALSLASKNLSSDWTQKVLGDAIKQVRYNLNLAQQARNELLQQVGVQGTQVETPAPAAPAAATEGATPAAAPREGQEGSINGVPAIWKTVNGKPGWYRK